MFAFAFPFTLPLAIALLPENEFHCRHSSHANHGEKQAWTHAVAIKEFPVCPPPTQEDACNRPISGSFQPTTLTYDLFGGDYLLSKSAIARQSHPATERSLAGFWSTTVCVACELTPDRYTDLHPLHLG